MKTLPTYPYSLPKARQELAQSKYAGNVPKTFGWIYGGWIYGYIGCVGSDPSGFLS